MLYRDLGANILIEMKPVATTDEVVFMLGGTAAPRLDD